MNNIQDTDIVEINHGGGGRKMDELINFITSIISPELLDKTTNNNYIYPDAMDDGTVLPFEHGRIVMTTDSHTVDPIFFTGGSLGDLSIAGTVNDLTVMGAQPLYLSLGMIIEEGFSFGDLKKICLSMKKRIDESGISIVCGDTKVMPKGTLSNIITNTTGVGRLIRNQPLADHSLQPGDHIVVTGYLGDHGASIIAQREGLELQTDLQSDVDVFWPYFREIVAHLGVHAMKDVTRGGLASALNEFAMKSKVCIQLDEEYIPIRPQTMAICDMLGLEALELSCEGTGVLSIAASESEEIIKILRQTTLGKDASIIGTVIEEPRGQVQITTDIGGTRILTKPYGEPIPRVC